MELIKMKKQVSDRGTNHERKKGNGQAAASFLFLLSFIGLVATFILLAF